MLRSSEDDVVVAAVVTEANGPSPGNAISFGSKYKSSGGFGLLDTIQTEIGGFGLRKSEEVCEFCGTGGRTFYIGPGYC